MTEKLTSLWRCSSCKAGGRGSQAAMWPWVEVLGGTEGAEVAKEAGSSDGAPPPSCCWCVLSSAPLGSGRGPAMDVPPRTTVQVDATVPAELGVSLRRIVLKSLSGPPVEDAEASSSSAGEASPSSVEGAGASSSSFASTDCRRQEKKA